MLRPARAVAALVAAGFIGSTSAGAAPTAIAAGVETFTLGNGLQVVVIPDHRAPIVTHMVWYKVGAADEVPGKSGIAHFLEHLMFKGTAAHPAGDFSARVTSVGGNENAFTTDDYTAFHQNVAKEQLGLMMEYEADRMTNLVLDDAAVLPERKVILEERRMRIDDDPQSQLGDAIANALYQNEHYRIPTIGWAHEMETLDKTDAIAFYDRYYTPNNAIVVVAGDVTTDEVKKLAEATYGKVPRRAEPPARNRPSEPPALASRTVTLADARVTQPMIERAYLVPSYISTGNADAEALDVLGEILGGGTTSRLYRQLVVEKAVATSAGAGYRGSTIDDTQFTVYAVPRGDTTLEALSADLDAVIADLVKNGVSDDELARAKRRIVANAIYAQDNHAMLARVFGEGLSIGQSVDDIQHWPAAIDAVTADQVVNAARSYLDSKRSVTGFLVGAPQADHS